jgi:hypothetical protein
VRFIQKRSSHTGASGVKKIARDPGARIEVESSSMRAGNFGFGEWI